MKNTDSKFWLGLFLVSIGALLVIDNYGFFYFDFRHMIFSWHTIFVIVGFVLLSKSKSSIIGIILLALGLIGWASHIFPFVFDFVWRDFWPIILIIIGFSILFRRRTSSTPTTEVPNSETSSDNQQAYSEEIIDINTILTSTKRKISSDNFRGGKITNLLGAAVIDLSNSKLAPGEHVLDISCVMGGVEIAVPRNWKVIVNLSAIFGGVDDKRFTDSIIVDKGDAVLIIKGTVLFGACEILHYM